MPNSTRRAFITSAAAVAVVAPVSVATAASAVVDPIFALITAWEKADADWLVKLDRFGKAEDACSAEKAIGAARIDVELCGVPFTFQTNEEIKPARTTYRFKPVSLPTFAFYGHLPVVYVDGELVIGRRVIPMERRP